MSAKTPKTIKVYYKPPSSLPQNFAGNFPVKGWGTVLLKPFPEENELAFNLAKILLEGCPFRISLVNEKDAAFFVAPKTESKKDGDK